MTRFEILRNITGVKEFSSLIFELAKKSETVEELTKELSTELPEEGLQTIRSVAQGGSYPLSLERMTRFNLLMQADTFLASRLIIHLGEMFDNPEALKSHLEGKVTDGELQQINAAALKEGCQPLSLSFKQ